MRGVVERLVSQSDLRSFSYAGLTNDDIARSSFVITQNRSITNTLLIAVGTRPTVFFIFLVIYIVKTNEILFFASFFL